MTFLFVLELLKRRSRIRVGLKSHVLSLQLGSVVLNLTSLYLAQDIFRRLTNPTLKKLYRFVLKRLVGRFLDDDIALEVRESYAAGQVEMYQARAFFGDLGFGGTVQMRSDSRRLLCEARREKRRQ